MRLHLTHDTSVEVVDADDCSSLAITAEVPSHVAGQILLADGIASAAEEGAVWLDVDELRRRAAPAGSDGWADRFDGMIAFARGKGWLDDSGRSVRAHLVTEGTRSDPVACDARRLMACHRMRADSSSSPGNRSHRHLANFRDVAGLRLIEGGTVPAGLLYRSDAPYPGDAAPEAVAVWPPATVIDLRSPGETAVGYCWPAGVAVHGIPLMRQAAIVGPAETGPAPARQLPSSLESLYRQILDMFPRRLASLLAVATGSEYPLLVHCTAGKDRTGIAIAVLLLVGGVEPADIVADYTATAPNMIGLLDRFQAVGHSLPAGVNANSELLGAPATVIGLVVDRLTGWPGGPQGWAQAHGAAARDVHRWQQHLTGGAISA